MVVPLQTMSTSLVAISVSQQIPWPHNEDPYSILASKELFILLKSMSTTLQHHLSLSKGPGLHFSVLRNAGDWRFHLGVIVHLLWLPFMVDALNLALMKLYDSDAALEAY
ncbi:unnamed protein product [Ilex paraguariensis]|uniref:Uncharacterized protein n=1 Tax=Ilex paraguariensis TaxID=185542 RepID=A0ABC8UE96_9AQUA